MFSTIRGRMIVILLAMAAAAAALIANQVRAGRALKLGLDLQGGMHLALGVDDPQGTLTPEAREDAIDQNLEVLRNRIDQFGVSEPLVQKVGNDRIIVELPGISDEERAKNIIRQSAFLEWKLVKPTQDFRLSANVGYLDAKYTDFCADIDGPSASATPPTSTCGDVTLLRRTRGVHDLRGGSSRRRSGARPSRRTRSRAGRARTSRGCGAARRRASTSGASATATRGRRGWRRAAADSILFKYGGNFALNDIMHVHLGLDSSNNLGVQDMLSNAARP